MKIRGFRIELGEIETAARLGSGASAAVCVVLGDPPAQRLVAYVAPETIDAATVRSACARTLPSYAVPSQVVVLAALPRNINGKVDRKALPPPPEPSADDGGDGVSLVAPRTPAEVRVRHVWASVLSCAEEAISVEADWPLLGGNSLLAGRATSLLRKELGVPLPGTAMYTHSTVARLAALAEGLGFTSTTDAMAAEDSMAAEAAAEAAAAKADAARPRLRSNSVLSLLFQLCGAILATFLGDTAQNTLFGVLGLALYLRHGRLAFFFGLPLLRAFVLAWQVRPRIRQRSQSHTDLRAWATASQPSALACSPARITRRDERHKLC